MTYVITAVITMISDNRTPEISDEEKDRKIAAALKKALNADHVDAHVQVFPTEAGE